MNPSKHKMNVLGQICKLIPGNLVSKLSREHGVDKQWREFSPWSHVTALLIYLLLRFIAQQSRWEHSFTRLFTMLRGVLWSALDMFSVLKCDGTARGTRMRASPEQSYLPGMAPA